MSWKTTLSGIVSIISGVTLCITGNYTEGAAAIAAGIGLLFAKDANK